MMIVKKIPILQGFPALETVKYLSNTKNELSEYNPIFYDIETTGLSRYTAFVYLIGAVRGWGKMKTRRFLFYRNLQVF